MTAIDPIDEPELYESKFTEIGASGLLVLGGRINEEFLPALQTDRAVKVWREMADNDPYTAAMLYGIRQLVLRPDWSVDQAESTEENAQFLEECMHDMSHPWRDVVSEAATCVQYGWSWLETVMKVRDGYHDDDQASSNFDDGKIGWRKMPLRAQETRWKWKFSEFGAPTALIQRIISSDISVIATHEIPIERSLLFRAIHHKNNPESTSLLRASYRPYSFRKRIEELEGIGIERDLAGLPVFWLPAEMFSPQAPADVTAAREEFKRIGQNIRNDQQACVMMPMEYDDNNNKMYDFTLASTMGRRLFDTTSIIQRWGAVQLMSVLADVMMLGQGNVGSLALSRTKADLFTAGIQTILDEIADVLNRFAVPRLFRMNGVSPPYPKFTTSPVEQIDAGDFMAMILQYAQAGAPLFPDDNLDTFIREKVGLPEKSPNEPGMDLSPPLNRTTTPPEGPPPPAKTPQEVPPTTVP